MANNYAHRYVPTGQIASVTDGMVQQVQTMRKNHERRWYDNNFFDDGHHFRYLSRTTGKIIDSADANSSTMPTRAIPKASRQIRGIANLISSLDPVPVVYPTKLTRANYQDPQAYEQAMMLSKGMAQKTGMWLQNEFKAQQMKKKMVEMLIGAAKHGVSFLQIWPDAVDEKILSQVYDAFDIYLMGNLTSIYDSPFIVKAFPELIGKIKANENYNEAQLDLISPDNKYASSEIKQAYMQAQYGSGQETDTANTLILKEAFIKEYLNDENYEDCKRLSEKTGAMEGKKKGDQLIRHTFSAGGVWLLDEYVALDEYPFVDYRFEPGPIYQTPLIERFIPANKSLDIAMSRVERFLNTMVAGTWLTRAGEDLKIGNLAGGQQVTYSQTKPEQAAIQGVPPSMFDFMTMLERNIDEQGVPVSSMNQLPQGVKSGVAIESLKATEYDNLRIATDQYKDTCARITERLLDYADEYFINPQTVYALKEGTPDYFDIIGTRGLNARRKLAEMEGSQFSMPENTIPISKDSIVDIEVESGIGYTMEGKKETMQQITNYVMQMSQAGVATTEVVKQMFKKLLETYQFGSTQELMDAFDTGMSTLPLNEEQITQMKVAVAESMKDMGMTGPAFDQKLVDSTKLGVVEAMRDTGNIGGNQSQPETPKGPSESISFKDLPVEGQAQMAAQAGIQITPQQIQAKQQEQQNQAMLKKQAVKQGGSNE